LPCVCYVLLQSHNSHFFSDLHFLEEFLPETYQTGIEGYIVTQFQIAARFLKEMNIQLHLDSLQKSITENENKEIAVERFVETKEEILIPSSPPREDNDRMPVVVSELTEIINLETKAQAELQKKLSSGEPPKVKSLIDLYEKTTGNPV
jgi:hypothetical protein